MQTAQVAQTTKKMKEEMENDFKTENSKLKRELARVNNAIFEALAECELEDGSPYQILMSELKRQLVGDDFQQTEKGGSK
mgnify:CR=1 FL=1